MAGTKQLKLLTGVTYQRKMYQREDELEVSVAEAAELISRNLAVEVSNTVLVERTDERTVAQLKAALQQAEVSFSSRAKHSELLQLAEKAGV